MRMTVPLTGELRLEELENLERTETPDYGVGEVLEFTMKLRDLTLTVAIIVLVFHYFEIKTTSKKSEYYFKSAWLKGSKIEKQTLNNIHLLFIYFQK